ncbi:MULTISPECIES: SAM-dependent methyltransferase [unclassified Methylophilus]|uniref:class I SAM-dependent methyltransferase n=1 Tax=unclassified Methylophilus TaxID=2630143 RepID=UPI000700ADB4|nr:MULTISPECIES: SAM-dependent methyltransferase [unclassified Methylophilus]KQT37230.1 SAM-dependent methyltransferase [Methylophilus sp. Leaf416]KQT55600.1 SAM-dependent methyltransferase [Methylophilus sp. Leaf459]
MVKTILPPEVKPGQSIPLLQALHILTRDGKLNQDSRRKLKQVYHLVNFIEPLMQSVMTAQPNPVLVDHGAGKSYLGFILYDLLLKQHAGGQVIGIENRVELIEKSRQLASECGFERMQFEPLTVADAMSSEKLPAKVDIVTALHACNTATDDAIQFGLQKQAQYMVLVPCCQAEVAEVMRQHKADSLAKTLLSELWRHPIHTRELGSHVTNVLRCLELEAHGYQVTVTELVGWEHSMKNELIIAKFTGQKKRSALERGQQLLEQLNLTSLASRFNFQG